MNNPIKKVIIFLGGKLGECHFCKKTKKVYFLEEPFEKSEVDMLKVFRNWTNGKQGHL